MLCVLNVRSLHPRHASVWCVSLLPGPQATAHSVHNPTSALFLRGCGFAGGDALHHGDKTPAACRPIRSGSAIRRAGTARVVTNIHSREMCDRAIISVVPTADSDVAIVRSSQVKTVEDEGQLNSLLEQCATDADNRMTIAARAIEGKLTRPDASMYDLVVSCVEEAHACDLQSRHATRLALEAALSQRHPACTTPTRLRPQSRRPRPQYKIAHTSMARSLSRTSSRCSSASSSRCSRSMC